MAESQKRTSEPIRTHPPMAPINDFPSLPSERDTTPSFPAPDCGIDEAKRDLAQCLQGSTVGLPLPGEHLVQYLRMRGHSESAAHWALHGLIARGLLILEPAIPDGVGGGQAIYPGGWHNSRNIAIRPTDRLFEPGALTSTKCESDRAGTAAEAAAEEARGKPESHRQARTEVLGPFPNYDNDPQVAEDMEEVLKLRTEKLSEVVDELFSAVQPPDQQAGPPDEKAATKQVKRPPDKAFRAYWIRELMGISKQTEIAQKMTENGDPATQGQVSRWLKAVEDYQTAGGIVPTVRELNAQPQATDPAILDMGTRQDGITPRQRYRRCEES